MLTDSLATVREGGVAKTGKRMVRRGLARVGILAHRLPHPSDPASQTMRVLSAYDVDAVLDVGANRGQYAEWLREVGYNGPIVSFEPETEAYAELQARAASDPHWQAQQVALAEAEGTLQLKIAKASVLSSFLTSTVAFSSEKEGARIVRTEDVVVTTLDSVAAHLPAKRFFLKVDTQGYDLKVLEGAKATLERVVVLQLELAVLQHYYAMPTYIDALTTASALGFTPAGMFPIGIDDRLRVIEYDGLFVRTDP